MRALSVIAGMVAPAVFAGLLAGLVMPWAMAQSTGSAGAPAPFAAAPANNDALQLLLEQNRQLRTELQALRGMVEEQAFEIRKLRRDALSRYTDVDERLRSLETAAGVPPAPVTTPLPGVTANPATTASSRNNGLPDDLSSPAPAGSPQPANPAMPANRSSPALAPATRDGGDNGELTGAGNRPAVSDSLQPTVLSEQQLYQMAYDSVINSNFERSIAEFDQYLSIYPDGRFVTNSHYWKGQAYLYLGRFAEARDSYAVIVEQYAESAKLPDALYGLALAYQGLGNVPRARQLLNDIKQRFPNTGVANLADNQLLSLD